MDPVTVTYAMVREVQAVHFWEILNGTNAVSAMELVSVLIVMEAGTKNNICK